MGVAFIRKRRFPTTPGEGISFSRFRYLRSQVRLFAAPAATDNSHRSHPGVVQQQRLSDVRGLNGGWSGGKDEFRGAFRGLVDDVMKALDTPGTEDVVQR